MFLSSLLRVSTSAHVPVSTKEKGANRRRTGHARICHAVTIPLACLRNLLTASGTTGAYVHLVTRE